MTDLMPEQLIRPRSERRSLSKQLHKVTPHISYAARQPAANRPDPL